jgi:hypothetical protein
MKTGECLECGDGRSRLNATRLCEYLLDQPWHLECELLPEYMPPFPRLETRPTVQVRHNNGTKYPSWLRYSKGPKQGYFWDMYGEDMQTVEMAILALSRAPAPVYCGPIEFSLPLSSEAS